MLNFSGGARLKGEIKVSGSKNAGMAIIAAAMLLDGETALTNIPLIDDILDLKDILIDLGADISLNASNVMRLNARIFSNHIAVSEKVRSIRASSYLLGAMLGRFGRAVVAAPGGCQIGLRPLNYHLDAFSKMGAEFFWEDGVVSLSAPALHGADITLPYPSVGATVNVMLGAVKARGITALRNCAREPHVKDTADFLNTSGADISGAGTETIFIRGVERLHSYAPYPIIPDSVEAGTYLIYTAITGGKVTLTNAVPEHIQTVIDTLRAMGAKIDTHDGVAIKVDSRLKATDIITAPHPGFPTDLQQLMMALMSVSEGTSTIKETVFENRFKNAEALIKLGAQIYIDGNTAVIEGVKELSGASVDAADLRGGAALIGAALAARGKTVLSGEDHIYRGYEGIVEKLTGLGAVIE